MMRDLSHLLVSYANVVQPTTRVRDLIHLLMSSTMMCDPNHLLMSSALCPASASRSLAFTADSSWETFCSAADRACCNLCRSKGEPTSCVSGLLFLYSKQAYPHLNTPLHLMVTCQAPSHLMVTCQASEEAAAAGTACSCASTTKIRHTP